MAALRAPGGRMQGAAAQAMSVHIVEPPQRRPRPTYAASGGNGGWARRPPGLAAAAPEARYRGPGSAATRTGAWVLRAIAALLVVNDAHRHRLPPRALRSPHNTHARDRLYFHHGLLRSGPWNSRRTASTMSTRQPRRRSTSSWGQSSGVFPQP